MKKFLKYSSAVLLMAGVIGGSILLPPALSNYNTQQMMGQVHFDNTADVNVYRYKLSEAEKLELIALRNSDGAQVLWNYNQFGPSSSELTEKEAVDACIKETQKLCKELFQENLADYDYEEEKKDGAFVSSSRNALVTIYDSRNPGKNISIWELTFIIDYQYYTFDIDAETGRILGFSVPSRLPEIMGVDALEIADSFASYLGYPIVQQEDAVTITDIETGKTGPFYLLQGDTLRISFDWNSYNLTLNVEKVPNP